MYVVELTDPDFSTEQSLVNGLSLGIELWFSLSKPLFPHLQKAY